jgi:NAD(P)-dependent dehydrogenase (short-subunit alcohol dehydrogenase family)
MGQKKSILIIGSSGGIGAALVQGYQAQGHTVRGLSRRGDGFDLADPASIDAHMSALDGPFDMIVMATGALVVSHAPEKTIKQVQAGAMMDQFAINAVGPALVLRHAARLLPRDRRAVFAVLSARVGSIGDNRLGGWISYRSAKAALNQIIKTASIELARSHPQSVVLALHPGTVQTLLTRAYLGRHPAVPPDQAAQNLMTVIAERTPAETGGFFDWAGGRVPW